MSHWMQECITMGNTRELSSFSLAPNRVRSRSGSDAGVPRDILQPEQGMIGERATMTMVRGGVISRQTTGTGLLLGEQDTADGRFGFAAADQSDWLYT